MTHRISVLVADDHAVLRAGLRALIDAQPDLRVIGEAGSGPEAIELTVARRPDVVLLDLTMPGNGFQETIRQLVRGSDDSRILVLTMHDDPAYMRLALLAGATGYIVKMAADTELIGAIRAVHAGRAFVNLMRPEEPVGAPRGHERAVADSLSPRERQVLRLLAQGHTNQEIADQVFLSVKTVETYRTRLYDKLGLKTRAKLYAFAVASGILEAPKKNQGQP